MYRRLKPTVPLKEQTVNYAFPFFICDTSGDMRFCILQKLKQRRKKKKRRRRRRRRRRRGGGGGGGVLADAADRA